MSARRHTPPLCTLQALLQPLCNRSLFIFSKQSRVRRFAAGLSAWPLFQAITLLAILANCVTLAMDR